MMEEENLLLYTDTKWITKIFDDCKKKGSYRAVANLFAYLSYENENFTDMLL